MARTRNPTIYLLQHSDGSFKLNPWTGVMHVFRTHQEAEQYRTAEYTCTEFRLIKVPNKGQGVQQDDSEHNSVPSTDW